jgi:hypothetical protein
MLGWSDGRALDLTISQTIAEVVEAIQAAVPDATPDEMIAALRQVGEEQMREADELEKFKAWRWKTR